MRDTTTLQFKQDAARPAIKPTVYDTLTTEFAGRPFQFNIIGSSHYIRTAGEASGDAVDGAYHEILSCGALSGDRVRSMRLPETPAEAGSWLDRVFAYQAPEYTAHVRVLARPIATFPDERVRTASKDGGFDLAYRFAEAAYTAIDIHPEIGSYTTYHTYPEYSCNLVTETRFQTTFTTNNDTNVHRQ